MNKLLRIILNCIETLLLIGSSMLMVLGIVFSNLWYIILSCMFVVIYAMIDESRKYDG